jgi:hypothetical protein
MRETLPVWIVDSDRIRNSGFGPCTYRRRLSLSLGSILGHPPCGTPALVYSTAFNSRQLSVSGNGHESCCAGIGAVKWW